MTRTTIILTFVLTHLLEINGISQGNLYCDSNLVVLSILDYDTVTHQASIVLKFPVPTSSIDSLGVIISDISNANGTSFSYSTVDLAQNTTEEQNVQFLTTTISDIYIPNNLNIHFQWWLDNVVQCDYKKNYFEILPE